MFRSLSAISPDLWCVKLGAGHPFTGGGPSLDSCLPKEYDYYYILNAQKRHEPMIHNDSTNHYAVFLIPSLTACHEGREQISVNQLTSKGY